MKGKNRMMSALLSYFCVFTEVSECFILLNVDLGHWCFHNLSAGLYPIILCFCVRACYRHQDEGDTWQKTLLRSVSADSHPLPNAAQCQTEEETEVK